MKSISRLVLIALMLGVMFLGGTNVQGADNANPLVLLINGDLWLWTGPDTPVKQITKWGYNETPVISPDGKYAAYLSTAASRVEQYKKGNTAFDDNGPQNIWVIDLATGTNIRVATQPAGASDSTWKVTRVAPVWSPDGKQLAWADLTCCIKPAPDGSRGPWQALVVYDWQKQSATTVAKQLPAGSNSQQDPSALDWGSKGITFLITPEPDAAYVYAPDGKQLARIALDDCVFCRAAHWLDTDTQPLLIVDVATKETMPYRIFDPSTGQEITTSITPKQVEFYSRSAPDGMVLYQDGGFWFAQEPGKTPVKIDSGWPLKWNWISIAPDGKQAAFVHEEKLFLISDGKISEVALGEGTRLTSLSWSTLGRRLKKP